MLFTVSLTVHFGSSDRLAAAEGTAVFITMVLATVLLLQSCEAGPDNDRFELRRHCAV
jgi:K+ transporter